MNQIKKHSLNGQIAMQPKYNCVVLLGPTAVGKTAIAVRLADRFGWDVISADSRQVYRGLDIASGKDLTEYEVNGKKVPFHLIDVADLSDEYNLFSFQRDFFDVFNDLRRQGRMPFVAGGTGMYLDCVVRNYELPCVPENLKLTADLEKKSLEELSDLLISMKPNLHNKTDLLSKDRVIKALQIELYKASPAGIQERERFSQSEKIAAFVIGTTLDRDELYENIEARLKKRIEQGMIEEVEALAKKYSFERIERLGLECRWIGLYLEGRITSKEEMLIKLCTEIRRFAKRQETWFRGMEKKGVKIHWLVHDKSVQLRFLCAVELVERFVL